MTTQTADVEYTTYEVTTTRNGKDAFLVTYHTKLYGNVKHWLFPGPKLHEWWSARCKHERPYDLKEAVRLANIGKVLPTRKVVFKRDGRFPTVVDTVVGAWGTGVIKFMREIREIDPDIEVVRVIA